VCTSSSGDGSDPLCNLSKPQPATITAPRAARISKRSSAANRHRRAGVSLPLSAVAWSGVRRLPIGFFRLAPLQADLRSVENQPTKRPVLYGAALLQQGERYREPLERYLRALHEDVRR